ncbi:MAG: glutathione peroxidase, partial [Bacteroidales bacterium]
MKRTIFLLSALVLAFTLSAQTKNFHSFTVQTIDGKECNLSSFKGKKVLVVNVASKCGLTPQYAQLQQLFDKYGS